MYDSDYVHLETATFTLRLVIR